MNLQLVTPLTGLLFILVFGGLAAVRQQGLSLQFALEGLALTAMATALIFLAGVPVNPVLFLVVIYLVTLRSRWLVDLGNFLSQRRLHGAALAAFALAKRLWPDPMGRTLACIGEGVAHLKAGSPEQAVEILQDALARLPSGIHPRYEAGCRYNLGLAYRRSGREEEANREFCRVLAVDEDSLFAIAARTALRQGASAEREDKDMPAGESDQGAGIGDQDTVGPDT